MFWMNIVSAIIWNLFRCNQRLVLFLCLELLLLWAASQNHRFDHFSIHIFPHQKYSFLEGNEQELRLPTRNKIRRVLTKPVLWSSQWCSSLVKHYHMGTEKGGNQSNVSRKYFRIRLQLRWQHSPENTVSRSQMPVVGTRARAISGSLPSCTVRTRSHESRDREFISEH